MKKYSLEDRDRGLLALIMTSGNERAASRALTVEGDGIPHQTLASWRKKYPERYSELETSYAPIIHDRLASNCESLALSYGVLERQVLDRAIKTVDSLEPKDLPNASRSYAVAKGVQMDKAAQYRGLPNVITESRDADQLLATMAIKIGIATKGK